MNSARPYDVVLFGATGFTGQLAAEYLLRKRESRPVRWAIAGRNARKLDEVRRALSAIDAGAAEKVGVIEASSDDARSLTRMAEQAQVVITTVGPYAIHGEPLVAACVDARADYVDITGEPQFVAQLLAKHDETARARGVRVVNCCGFDSIPHDLGAYFTVKQLPANEPIAIEGFVRAKGAPSGGTWQSAINAMSHLRESAASARPPRGTSPDGRRVHGMPARVHYDREMRAWAAPLPTIDPLVVLRSARALPAYGPDFSYGHYAQVRSTAFLVGGAVGIATIAALAQFGPTRQLLLDARKSGEGPSAEQRAQGRFRVTFRGKARSARVFTTVSGGDPGYTETAKMLSESALCLAFDRARLPEQAGVVTTAVAMGDALLERLQSSGIRFEVVPAPV